MARWPWRRKKDDERRENMMTVYQQACDQMDALERQGPQKISAGSAEAQASKPRPADPRLQDFIDDLSPKSSEIINGIDLSSYTKDIGINAKDFQFAMDQLKNSLDRVQRDMFTTGQAFELNEWKRGSVARKVIKDVTIEWNQNWIDVSTLDKPGQQIPGTIDVTIRDHEGEPVPEELRRKILDIVGDRTGEPPKDLDKRLRETLEDWNRGGPEPMDEVPPGHLPGCVYRRSHHFACTCQPPTIWGKTKLWYCDCCEEPRALIQYGVCEMCEPHEYSDARQAELDHEAAKLNA